MDSGKNAPLFLHQSLYWNHQYAKMMQIASMVFCLGGFFVLGNRYHSNNDSVLSYQAFALIVFLTTLAYSFAMQILTTSLNLKMRLNLKVKDRTRKELVGELNRSDYNFGQSDNSIGKFILEQITKMAYINRFAGFLFTIGIVAQICVLCIISNISIWLLCLPVIGLITLGLSIAYQMNDYYINGSEYIAFYY